MRTAPLYVILVLLVLLSIFGDHVGMKTAGWNDPITSTDIFFFFVGAVTVVMIEVRNAARWVVDQRGNS